ncbi:hypothetical protein KKH46_01555 [Patescibacteria group bacterium]|nr:hypothetical protein [Patescibacteria group bacterium]
MSSTLIEIKQNNMPKFSRTQRFTKANIDNVLENKVNDEWSAKRLSIFIPAPTPSDSPAKWVEKATTLGSVKKYISSWSQQIMQYEGNDGEQVKEGAYRIKLIYYAVDVAKADLWVDITDWSLRLNSEPGSFSDSFF